MSRLRELHPRRFFLDTWRQIDVEAREERRGRRRAGPGYDYRPMVALATGAVFLTLMDFWGGDRGFNQLLDYVGAGTGASALRASAFYDLVVYGWWLACRLLAYVALPMLVLALLGERIRDYGLSTRGLVDHAWMYALFYLVILAGIVVASGSDAFSTHYPLYALASRSWFDLIVWELLYMTQFFALEFFFRGFWLKACKSAMGSQAIFAMTVPYCLIHYSKPQIEALAAVGAGIALGTLAMRTRSIWGGVIIHAAVGLSMDAAALLRNGALPTTWWPGPS